jgi:Ca2+-binding EF-hand superfamily protein
MKKLSVLLAAGALLAGCGVQPTVPTTVAATMSAKSTAGLTAGFEAIHKAVFGRLDANHDSTIDEFEAGATISLKDYQKVDLNHDGVLQYSEFMSYATKGGFLQKNDNPSRWVARFRDSLGNTFKQLDKSRDGLLEAAELSDAALTKSGLGFFYESLNVSLKLTSVTDEQLKAGDRTGDGKLSPAEFEDLYVAVVVDALNPPAPPAPPAKKRK